MVHGQWLFRNLWKVFGGLHPCLSFFYLLHLCCSSNHSPQLKSQQVGLYHPELGESRAVRGERPAWSPRSVDICASATPTAMHPHVPLQAVQGCLSLISSLLSACTPNSSLLSSLASPPPPTLSESHPRAGHTTHLLPSLAAAASACLHPESTVNKSWTYPDL